MTVKRLRWLQTSTASARPANTTSRPDRARHLAQVEHGQRQRAVGDELALRHQDHARDREHQHQRQRQQRVDGAVGDAVLQEEEQDRGVQGARSGSAGYEGTTGHRRRQRCTHAQRVDACWTKTVQEARRLARLARMRPQRPSAPPIASYFVVSNNNYAL